MAETGFCRQKSNPVSTSQLYCSSMDLEFHWPFYKVILSVRCHACFCWFMLWFDIVDIDAQARLMNWTLSQWLVCCVFVVLWCVVSVLCIWCYFMPLCTSQTHTHTATHAILMVIQVAGENQKSKKYIQPWVNKLQPNHHHQRTNTVFSSWMSFLSLNQLNPHCQTTEWWPLCTALCAKIVLEKKFPICVDVLEVTI